MVDFPHTKYNCFNKMVLLLMSESNVPTEEHRLMKHNKTINQIFTWNLYKSQLKTQMFVYISGKIQRHKKKVYSTRNIEPNYVYNYC